jgi:hypothetical protein
MLAGLQLTDAVLQEAAEQQVGGLDVLAQAVLRQQQAQHPGSTALKGVTPLLQVALLGTGAELTDAVSLISQAVDHALLQQVHRDSKSSQVHKEHHQTVQRVV